MRLDVNRARLEVLIADQLVAEAKETEEWLWHHATVDEFYTATTATLARQGAEAEKSRAVDQLLQVLSDEARR